jgi:hypothetical protein
MADRSGRCTMRCLECGAEPAETVQVCVRCGAPAGLHQPVAAAPAAGGLGSAIAPLAVGAPARPRGQRTGRYSRRKGLVVAGAGIVLLAAPITVIGAMDSSAPSANQSASSTNQPTSDQLRSGDCLAGSNMHLGNSTPWPEYVTRVPCTKRHEAEVFFAANVWPQSQAFPGKAAIGSRADARCGEAFTAYDGIDVSQSAFTYDEIVLDSSDWASGDRSLACVAYEPSPSGPSGGAPVNYSIKGSKK